MNRRDKIKLSFTRNWKFPGRERLARILRSSSTLRNGLKNGITWLNDEPVAIYTTADNYIECCVLETGSYENEIEKLISVSLKEGDVALDIGANIGLQSLRMGRYAGLSGQVLAFEPLSHLQKKFAKNILLNRLTNITLFPFALSDIADDVERSVNDKAWNQGTFSLTNIESSVSKQKIKIVVADEMPEIKALLKLSLVKVDVEGFELNVLRGMQKTLARFRPRIIFEYDHNYWIKSGQSIDECFIFLKELDYNIYQIFGAGCELLDSSADCRSGNLLCIPNSPDK